MLRFWNWTRSTHLNQCYLVFRELVRPTTIVLSTVQSKHSAIKRAEPVSFIGSRPNISTSFARWSLISSLSTATRRLSILSRHSSTRVNGSLKMDSSPRKRRSTFSRSEFGKQFSFRTSRIFFGLKLNTKCRKSLQNRRNNRRWANLCTQSDENKSSLYRLVLFFSVRLPIEHKLCLKTKSLHSTPQSFSSVRDRQCSNPFSVGSIRPMSTHDSSKFASFHNLATRFF